DARDPHHVETTELDRRTLQILYRAAYHFRAKRVDVISAYRKAGAKSEGQHGTGRAIDFKLKNVGAPALAAYLRGQARVGVGVYTHPKTQYVHLDVRERSYYWLDASPPGRTWRERQLVQSGMAARDAGYARANDWPEGTVAPPF
ncbi:MAG TPA: D-Ala-D-Ala carboxypeptidase family metallohydrolase, partial [Polyangiaceae bacterium]|nr:D-Ala-D-Ala carboxypeptidase family metallohydrolase [Polyangiaceae bacterium]